MTVEFHSGGRANERDIAALERVIGQPLSHDFLEFVQSFDGAKPDSNLFAVASGIHSGVNQFIPVARILLERRNVENISGGAYPIAWAEGGNYVTVDEERQGAVFFWDHEVPHQEHKIAASFATFLELLNPFDPSSVQLAPGQVRSVWVNPDFLKRFGKQE